MNCPNCKITLLVTYTLAGGLEAETCQECRGQWVSSQNYFAWLRAHAAGVPDTAPYDAPPPVETGALKICPQCGHVLRRYKIWPDIAFFLDHCSSCNGVWFDRDEWETLERHNLHDNLNEYFTKPWQRKLHAEEEKIILQKMYLDKLGVNDYAKIQEVRDWIRSHPRSGMLLAYLQADDPYKV